MSDFHKDLPAGTFLVRSDGYRIRLIEDMKGEWAYCEKVRLDGTRDRRQHGWSGSLRLDLWTVRGPNKGEAGGGANGNG